MASTIILFIFAALSAGSYGGGSVNGMLQALTAYRFLLGIGIGYGQKSKLVNHEVEYAYQEAGESIQLEVLLVPKTPVSSKRDTVIGGSSCSRTSKSISALWLRT